MFANPAAYTPGVMGRNVIDGPAINWSQGNIAKTITVKEKYNLDVRFDINNIFKSPNFSNPASSVNIVNPGLFGKPTGTSGDGAASEASPAWLSGCGSKRVPPRSLTCCLPARFLI